MSVSITSTPRLSLLAIFALAVPLSAQTTIFNNFGTGNTYQTDAGDTGPIGGSQNGGNAVSFSSPLPGFYTLNQIQIAGTFVTASPDATASNGLNNLTVALWISSTDLNSATQLETWTLTPPAPPQIAQVFTLTPASSNSPGIVPVFLPGMNYFITANVQADGANTAGWLWQQNNLMPNQVGYLLNLNGGPWISVSDTTPVFSVSGDLIPPLQTSD